MATILDTDILLVDRGGKSYKVTGAEVREYVNTKRVVLTKAREIIKDKVKSTKKVR